MTDVFDCRDMNQKLRDDKDAIEAAHEAVGPGPIYTNLRFVCETTFHNEFMHHLLTLLKVSIRYLEGNNNILRW